MFAAADKHADPSTPYAPIHELVDDRNSRIKSHYWNLWGLSSASSPSPATLKLSDEFQGETVTVDAREIAQFCTVTGIDNEAYKPYKGKDMQVPMDFAIKLGWKVMSLFIPRAETMFAHEAMTTRSPS